MKSFSHLVLGCWIVWNSGWLPISPTMAAQGTGIEYRVVYCTETGWFHDPSVWIYRRMILGRPESPLNESPWMELERIWLTESGLRDKESIEWKAPADTDGY